jgi:hypothetical protein
VGGAGAVRLLLAMETLQEQATGPDQVEREFILGLQWSAAMHDGLAWAAFATYGTRRRAALHASATDALSQLRNMQIFEP